MSTAVKRIVNRDLKEIQRMNLSELGIHIHFDEEDMLFAKAIIIGPKGTPYENGILYFKIEFPKNYPFSPPKVKYMSSSKNRIHPNLYVGLPHNNFEGKVCLSIINTWSGPKWTSIMHIGSILISIQSLLDNNPLRNEPGFEFDVSWKNKLYNQIVEYNTYEHLIIKNCSMIPPEFDSFSDIILGHIQDNKEEIRKKMQSLKEKHQNKKVSFDIYRIYMIMNYALLLKKFDTVFKVK